MEWNSKLPSWYFADLEQNEELNMASLIGPSLVLGGRSRGADCSVDLKLGGLGDRRSSDKWKAQPATGAAAAPPRRARASGNGGGQVAACLVDGCRSDLSNSREYHRRHKVCEAHSKTPVVMVGGEEQRFCQQCSRFHQLAEFDEVKRSCRKRLDGHNRRRRKPHPDSKISPSSLFPNNQGNEFFMYPHLIPTTIHDQNWSGLIKSEDTAHWRPHFPSQVTDTQRHSPSYFSGRKSMKHFPFLQHDRSTMTAFSRTTPTMAQSAFQPFLKTPRSPQSSSGSSRRILSDSAQVFGLDCAPSLLSSTQNPGALLEMGQMLPAGRIPLRHQSAVSSLPCAAIGRQPISQARVERAGLACDANHAGSHHQCQCAFGVMGEEGSSEEASLALPFYWQ